MNRVEKRPLRLFRNELCSVSYRLEKHATWLTESLSYSLVYLARGSFSFTAPDCSGKLVPNTFLLVNPATSAKYLARNASLLSLELSPALVIDCAARTRLAGASSSVTFRAGETLSDRTISRVAADLIHEISEVERGHEAAIAALVEQLVIHVLRHYSILKRTDALEFSRVGLIDRRLRRAVELMLAQLDEELSLKDLAAASCLSQFHFARLFKKATGFTPHAYLAALRTTTAQRLLAETDLSITEISLRVGFASPSHFAKAFRQTTGLSPRAFRAAIVHPVGLKS